MQHDHLAKDKTRPVKKQKILTFYDNLTRMPRPVDGDEWLKKFINNRNRGGDSHEFGVMPRLVGGDSQIQEISLLLRIVLLEIVVKLQNI